MTTAVKEHEEGQSVIEFLIMLPVVVGLAVFMVKVNTVIQMGIVNQQYSRAQALNFSYNSPVYPHLERRPHMIKLKYDQILMGVKEYRANEEGDLRTESSTYKITKTGGSVENQSESIHERSEIRVRNTVTLCTQMNLAGNGKPLIDLNEAYPFKPKGAVNLNEGTEFVYCKGPTRYVSNE